MHDLPYTAAVHRIMLELGLTRVADVITWADGEIAATDDPPAALIDVSMGRTMTATEMADRLRDLIVDHNDTTPTQHVMGGVAKHVRSGDWDTSKAILQIYNYLRSEGMLYTDPFTIFHNLETDLALIRDGIFPEAKITELRNDLLEALDAIAAQHSSAG